MSFRSPNGTHYLCPIRYYGVFIENTYFHQPLIVTQSIGICDHFKVSPIGPILSLILAYTQYPLKVESPYSIVASLVNHENCVMIDYRSCLVCISYTSALTMGNSSQRPRQAITPIRTWCTTISTRLP